MLAIASLCSVGNAQTSGNDPRPGVSTDVQDLSLVQLMANPEKYDGKQVKVTGFLSVGSEGTAIYLHRDDFEHGIDRNAISVNLPRDMSEARTSATDLHYVVCEGTFRASHDGHSQLFPGELSEVRRLEAWHSFRVLNPPADPTP